MKRFASLSVLLAAGAFAADLPVRQVVLYKHGVGYFERVGLLQPGETARLDFKATEMDDVLKSLTIRDANGGRVSGLRYDSHEPLAHKLSEFPFQLQERQPLSLLLDTLKGARIEVQFGSESVTGAIVSGRVVAAGQQRPESEQLTLLLDSGELRTLDLSGATNLRLQDPELQEHLRRYLTTLAGARSREKRSVYIDSANDKPRQIVAGYIVPMPVWKSSYRLVFGEKGEPLLEGWAIVDNVTGEDWSNVRLSLVSGRPISFISRLYEPRYVERPTAELAEDRPRAPEVHAGALDEARRAVARDALALAGVPEARLELRREVASTVLPATGAREIGELFEYNFTTPVNVRRGESAMLPFLQQQIAARKLLIYSDHSTQHPMNAAELANNTERTLDGGPVTIFDAGAYAGEGLMETLKAGDRRLVSYAIDLGTRITTRFDSTSDIIREIHFRRGVLTTRRALQETRTYTIRNVDTKPKTLVIEHPARPEFKLINVKPSETTATAYRFEVPLQPGASEKFPVTEERVYETTIAAANLTRDVLISFVQNKALSEAARKQLEQLLRLKGQLAETDGEIRRTEQEAEELGRDQERIRKNIASLSSVSGQQEQVQNYARQLAAQESRMAALRDRLAELRKKRAALESEVNALIEKMEF